MQYFIGVGVVVAGAERSEVGEEGGVTIVCQGLAKNKVATVRDAKPKQDVIPGAEYHE